MSAFVIYMAGIISSILVFKKARKLLFQSRYWLFSVFLLAGIVVSAFTLVLNNNKAFANLESNLEDPNLPIGTGVGINPGQVVWIHAADATNENCQNTFGDYWSSNSNTDQEVVNEMISEALQTLSNTSSDAEAWDAIFTYHNENHDKGDVGYTIGEKIVIKLNMNTANKESATRSNYTTVDTSPQIARAILDQLINVVGVQPSDISIGDPGRTVDDIYWSICYTDFPDVHYWGVAEGRTPVVESDEKVFLSSDGERMEYLPKSYVEAEYMINIPVLKKHHRGGISLSSKNHFGTFVPFNGSAFALHPSLPCPDGKADVSNGEYGAYRIFVDFIGHKDMGGKTILYLMDGLWTTTNWAHPPIKWAMTPFNNDYPSSIFLSQDPVAIESVGFDFLREEFDEDHPTEGAYDPTDHTGPFPQYAGVDDFLHQAASSENWPDGFIYDPEDDGTALPESMGAHEHWNNAVDKLYTRNLGGETGIDLVYVNLATDPTSLPAFDTDQSNSVITLHQNYPNPFRSATTIGYILAVPATINMSVYDIGGKLVENLVAAKQGSGEYAVSWNGSDASGMQLQAGIYTCVAEAQTSTRTIQQTMKIIIEQ